MGREKEEMQVPLSGTVDGRVLVASGRVKQPTGRNLKIFKAKGGQSNLLYTHKKGGRDMRLAGGEEEGMSSTKGDGGEVSFSKKIA